MPARETGFFTSSDATDIWYQSVGQGPLTMVLCDGVACTGYIWKYFIPYFAQQYRIIHSQYRGHGDSAIPRNLDTMTVETFAKDINDLLDYLDVKGPIILVGHSMGVQVALECYRQKRSIYSGLILINGPYGEALRHVHGNPIFAKALPWLKKAFFKWDQHIQKVWRPLLDSEIAYLYAVLFEVNPWLTRRRDFRVYFEDVGAMKPLVYIAALDGATRHSAEDLLPEIKVPTLVVAGDKDRFTPYPICLKLHRSIPGADLLTLPTGSHIGPLELPEFIHLRIEKFIAERVKPGELKKTAEGAEGPSSKPSTPKAKKRSKSR
ncbi:MAG TPA: alpha/beta hydrolase [Oligoflexus sp.]|uniref:alpha/beta fold hydrolase n=1 Tax=Oligoflexus sp. TaxID=1971216 RepID=UPI002D7F8ECC|nr:alpha/beta hydrolase [Oligoflexus sp.]HET9237272.1 alpha/beta hydrolase [Oligoflexus sp.]